MRAARRLAGLSVALLLAGPAGAGTRLLPPESVLGFAPCADYQLAPYEAIDRYLATLDEASDRLKVFEIGRSVEGRPLRLAVISSPRNMARLDRFRGIAASLARASRDGRPLSDGDARELAAGGRAVVWVDFGLHSSEVAHAQAAPLFVWRMVSGETPEIRRMRDDVILLVMPNMNPDGTTQVAEWYARHRGTAFERAPLPELYHRYTGHDNNRDWFMLTQPESRAVARQLYEVWYPQIVHNQHQEAPFPARIFVPPFADPVNPHIPALVVRGVNLVGDAIARRLEREGKVGAVSRLQFDAWWNGGMRTAPYFHNMIGILTETAHASASPATYDAERFPATFANGVSTREPSMYYPSPYLGGRWTQRDSCEYMLTASMAVVDLASRRRDEWLYDMYRMARDQIRAGASETFLVPPDQWDPPTAVALVDTLRRGGVDVDEALEPFEAGGGRYPAGTFVIRGAQPFRAYVRDLLRPQRYPDLRRSSDAPPERPYDITGWTLPLQMGVRVVEIASAVTARTRPVEAAASAPRPDPPIERATHYLVDPRINNAVRLVNRLLDAGEAVERVIGPLQAGSHAWPPGAFVVPATDASRPLVARAVEADGVSVVGALAPPEGTRVAVRRSRVGLYRPWGGNIDEGWTRYVLEQFGFAPLTLRNEDIGAGGLGERVDVVVLADQSYPALLKGLPASTMPAPYAGGLGPAGVAALHAFVAGGGTLVTLDSASELPLTAFTVPAVNLLAGLRPHEFFIPGSILKLDVDNAHPLAWGMPSEVSAFFAHGLAFGPAGPFARGEPHTWDADARVVASYARTGLLQSGWQLGGERLHGRAALLDLRVGRGRVVLVGFRTQHRAQPHATFKFLFNALLAPPPGLSAPDRRGPDQQGRQ